MGVLTRDTHSSAERAQIEILRAHPPWRKLELLGDGCEANRILMLAGLRMRFPHASEDELNRRLMGLLWGEETAQRVLGRAAASRR